MAQAIAAIHDCHVIHGDLWPANIFVSKSGPPHVKLIDFGESTTFFPGSDRLEQKDHPFRAPERSAVATYVSTDAVDVYSFGKLAMWLATNSESIIPREAYGRKRRLWLREKLLERNPALVKGNPEVLDIIATCVALDPADRPTMASVIGMLRPHDHLKPADRRAATLKMLDVMRADYEKGSDDSRNTLYEIVDAKLREIAKLIAAVNSDMITIEGQREYLIESLAAMIGELGEGDSWTTVTAPDVWQSSALGLDGRYLTATVQALRRKAAINRAWVVSVEDLGSAWCDQFVDGLMNAIETCGSYAETSPDCKLINNNKREALVGLKEAFAAARKEAFGPLFLPSGTTTNEYAAGFVDLLESLWAAIRDWELHNFLHHGKLPDLGQLPELASSKQMFIGLIPVATSARVAEIRARNPASLMYRGRYKQSDQAWLLIMTDIRGRREGRSTGGSFASKAPHLKGVRVHRSVMGRPNDRIIGLQDAFQKDARNIGSILEVVTNCARVARDAILDSGEANVSPQ